MISVIIPVYNASRYIDSCVKSVLKQTYDNWELIFIDDGSSDDSFEKCRSWAKTDSRIKVLHEENGGPAKARNYGLDMAKGEYISFLDVDDWWDENFLKIMYETIQMKKCQIAVCGFNQVDKDGKVLGSLVTDTIEYNFVQDYDGSQFFPFIVWQMLIDRDVLEKKWKKSQV